MTIAERLGTMIRIAVSTDSNSGISRNDAKRLGVSVLPMPFMINGELFFEDINLSQEEFYECLKEGLELSTSQPAPNDLSSYWDELLRTHDAVVHIPMSSGLSASCGLATIIAEDYGGRVQVVNNKRISVTQRRAVIDALELAGEGFSSFEIKRILEGEASQSSIYIMVDTLKYLKRGGRVTPAAAAVSAVLSIKPVLQIQGDKLDAYAKVKGSANARSVLIQAMKKDFENRFTECSTPESMHLFIAYTNNKETAQNFRAEVSSAFPGFDIHMDPLSLSVACHIGPGSLAIACSRKVVP